MQLNLTLNLDGAAFAADEIGQQLAMIGEEAVEIVYLKFQHFDPEESYPEDATVEHSFTDYYGNQCGNMRVSEDMQTAQMSREEFRSAAIDAVKEGVKTRQESGALISEADFVTGALAIMQMIDVKQYGADAENLAIMPPAWLFDIMRGQSILKEED